MSAILEFADKLRAQIDIVDVVGRYVELRRMGTNLKGLCPFHNEKTPSFTVSSTKQIFHCFGCHEGGDIIKFVQKVERLEWMDSVRHLSREFGIPMPELRAPTEQENQAKDARGAAQVATKMASEIYRKHLAEQLAGGAEIKGYLERRGMTPAVLDRFEIGLAPDGWTTVLDQGQKRGLAREALFDAGLVIRHATKDRVYDRFRKRLIFPIHDGHGVPIAFGARVYAADASPEEPKYINSPETVAYHKGQALYGLHLAKDTIVREKRAILMEGYMDVIRAHSCGVTNCVASCGTAFTEEQARTLKRFCTDVVFVYDGDDAGQKAMLRGTETLLQQGFNVAVVSLPDGHDPDSFLVERGAEQFGELVTKARNFFEHFTGEAARLFDLRSAEGKVQAVEMLLPLMRRVANPVAKNDYVRRLADRLNVDAALIKHQLQDNNPRSFERLRQTMAETNTESDGVVETTLLKLMVECPNARAKIREKIKREWLRNPLVRKWFGVCEEKLAEELNWENLLGCDAIDSDKEAAFLRALAVQEEGCDSSDKTIDHVAARLNRNYLRYRFQVISREIDEFFQAGHTDEVINEQVRQADDNVTPVKYLRNSYFLKNGSVPRRNDNS